MLFPASVRLYSNVEGNLLEIKEGQFPSLLSYFFLPDGTRVIPEFDTLKDQIMTRSRRLSREYFMENFWIYNIGDYGHQALSQGFQDFIPFCYYADKGDKQGVKVKQHNISIIKNMVSKESFILLPKGPEKEAPKLNIIIEQRNAIKRLISDSPDTKSIELTRTDNNPAVHIQYKNSQNRYQLFR